MVTAGGERTGPILGSEGARRPVVAAGFLRFAAADGDRNGSGYGYSG